MSGPAQEASPRCRYRYPDGAFCAEPRGHDREHFREALHQEANDILDRFHSEFLFDKTSDWRITAVEGYDTRLRVILCLLTGVSEET